MVSLLWLAFVPVPGLMGGTTTYPGAGGGVGIIIPCLKVGKKPERQRCHEGWVSTRN